MKHIKPHVFENQNPIDLEKDSIIQLADYTTEDKIKFFDKMYKLASDTLSEVKREKYKDDDTDNWFFEEGFSILNLKDKKKLWNYYNKLTEMKHINKFDQLNERNESESRPDDVKDLVQDIEELIEDRIFELSQGSTSEFKTGLFASGIYEALKTIMDKIEVQNIELH